MTETADDISPFVSFSRAKWATLADSTPLPLGEEDVARLRSLGDPIELSEVEQIYRPLSRLLVLHARAKAELHRATTDFLRGDAERTPFVIGIAGSVAAGKSTTARLLAALLARWPESPRVALVTTDGFLRPNAELARRGIMERKGFPESYDRRALRRFVAAVKSGAAEVTAPVYSHLEYDVLPGRVINVRRPDILILEGLNVLQPASRRDRDEPALAVSDYIDVSIYVDVHPEHVRSWYIERFLSLRATAFARPESYFHAYSSLDDAAARARAAEIWDKINAPNLAQNIAPTRSRATIILAKGEDHAVQSVRVRKL